MESCFSLTGVITIGLSEGLLGEGRGAECCLLNCVDDSTGKVRKAFFLTMMLYSAYRDISKKWTVMPVQNWSVALSHLSVIFDQRFKDVL